MMLYDLKQPFITKELVILAVTFVATSRYITSDVLDFCFASSFIDSIKELTYAIAR